MDDGFRWASGDVLARLLSEAGEPLTFWEWSGPDPLRVAWRGPLVEKRNRGRTLRRLAAPHFTIQFKAGDWVLTRKETPEGGQ